MLRIAKVACGCTLLAASAAASADRYGWQSGESNVSGAGMGGILLYWLLGGVCGYLYAKHQQSKGRAFATDGGVIVGALIAFLTSPFAMALM